MWVSDRIVNIQGRVEGEALGRNFYGVGRFKLTMKRNGVWEWKECLLVVLIFFGQAAHAAVFVKELQIPREGKGDALMLRVYYPGEGSGPWPLVVFSHGFGAGLDAFEVVSREVAAGGVVVVHPQHQDGVGRQAGGGEGLRAGGWGKTAGGGGLVARISEAGLIEGRLRDLRLVVDQAEVWEREIWPQGAVVDLSRVGVAGHSLGAYGAQLLMGVRARVGGGEMRSFRDERFKAGILVSPQGAGQQGLEAESWDQLRSPTLVITGTRDRGAGGQPWEWKREPFDRSPPGNKFLLILDGAHHVAFGGFRGQPNRWTPLVSEVSRQFWKAILCGDEQAGVALRRGIERGSRAGVRWEMR